MTHMIKFIDGKQTVTKCNISISKKIASTVKATVWQEDVTCPICKPGSSEMYLVIRHEIS